MFVPERYVDAVAGHVAHNALFPAVAPLMMAIIGSSGTGKSFQLREVARQLVWKIIELPASALAGEREGAVVKILHEAYAQAGDALEEYEYAFLVIDDFDLSLASIRPGVETSQHTQMLRSALMELCDRPGRIASQFPMRIPIVLTTNTLDAVYAPLIRHGRLHVFHWEPTEDELASIIENILIGMPVAHVKAIGIRYAGEGLAFFRELKSEVLKDIIIKRIRRDRMVVGDIRTADIEAEFCSVSLEHLDFVANSIRRARERLNYLES